MGVLFGWFCCVRFLLCGLSVRNAGFLGLVLVCCRLGVSGFGFPVTFMVVYYSITIRFVFYVIITLVYLLVFCGLLFGRVGGLLVYYLLIRFDCTLRLSCLFGFVVFCDLLWWLLMITCGYCLMVCGFTCVVGLVCLLVVCFVCLHLVVGWFDLGCWIVGLELPGGLGLGR